MTDIFLQVNKSYLGSGLKSIDILIIAQIEEFHRNKHDCYVTNKQFATLFGESESTIERSMKKLADLNIINRKTIVADGNGKCTRKRLLSVNSKDKWYPHNEDTKNLVPSKSDFGTLKNGVWYPHNDGIKEKEKNKEKDNIYKDSFKLDISFDSESQEDIDCGLSSYEEWEDLCFNIFSNYIEDGYTSFEVEDNIIYCLDSEGFTISSSDF